MATGPANQTLGLPQPPPGQRASWAPGAGPEGPKGGPCLRPVPQAAGKKGVRDKLVALEWEAQGVVKRAQAGPLHSKVMLVLRQHPGSLTMQSVLPADWSKPHSHPIQAFPSPPPGKQGLLWNHSRI